ncbi:MAG: hypothetical protein MZW92_23190 [Comamonadaceae bacterium]|nr:hypothetical protein [Comamonadaceae bacterium]
MTDDADARHDSTRADAAPSSPRCSTAPTSTRRGSPRRPGAQRPFATLAALKRALVEAVREAGRERAAAR